MVEITNREDLEAWLKDKPRKVAVVIAARAALRVQPVLARIFDTKMSKQRQNALYLQSHRAMLASAVAAAYPAAESAKAAAAYADAAAYTADGDSDAYADAAAYTADGDSDAYGYAAVVVAAAAAAAYAVDAGIDAANAAAYAVAYASAADAAAAAAVWAAVSRDCAEVDPENSGALFLRPIWPDGPPAFIARNETRSGPQRAAPHWSFWHRWYASMRDGHPLNRDLQRNIAAIHSGLWKKGPEHIAELIAGIEARFSGSDNATLVDAERRRAGEALTTHVAKLLNQAAAAELNAVGLVRQMDRAIEQYLNESGENCLPDEFTPMEAIKGLLAAIGGKMALARIEGKAKDGTIDDLEALIAELKLRNEELLAKLKAADGMRPLGHMERGFYTTLGGALAASGIGAATYFIAPDHAPDLVRHLGDRFMTLLEKPKIFLPQIGVK